MGSVAERALTSCCRRVALGARAHLPRPQTPWPLRRRSRSSPCRWRSRRARWWRRDRLCSARRATRPYWPHRGRPHVLTCLFLCAGLVVPCHRRKLRLQVRFERLGQLGTFGGRPSPCPSRSSHSPLPLLHHFQHHSDLAPLSLSPGSCAPRAGRTPGCAAPAQRAGRRRASSRWTRRWPSSPPPSSASST